MATGNPRSTAQVGGHPIHPMLVYFPIAFFSAAFVTDLMSLGSASAEWWAQASLYLIGAGLVTAVFAAAAGAVDFFGSERIRHHSVAWWHAGINVSVVVLELASFYLRYDGSPVSFGLAFLSGVCVALLVVSGWLGGEMVYRHGIAVLDREDGY
jgi:uncharacterized membrane protein